jgi:bacterioferritin (cytochrome b1)
VVNEARSAAPVSRRALLQTSGAGLAAGIAVMAAGCGGQTPTVTRTISPAARSANVEILNLALDLEHKAIAAYTAGIPLLSGHAQKSAQRFLAQELQHADELFSLIRHQDGQPNKPQPTYDLGRPQSRKDVLQLLHEIERAQVRAYLAAIPEVTPGTYKSALGAILGSDAQHVALLRAALGTPPLAGAFVTGNE